MSGAHTPGPWRVKGGVTSVRAPGSKDGAHKLYSGRIYPETGKYIGSICHVHSADHISGISREQSAANALLIAAAPCLLAALEALLPELDIEIETRQLGGNAEDWADLECLTQQARAAIAKAKGGAA